MAMSRFPHTATLQWKSLWWICFVLRPFLCKLDVRGLEHIPAAGGVVVASNHTSAMDIILNGYCSPRQLHFIAKAELFAVNPLVSRLLHVYGVIPLTRGGRDMDALSQAVEMVTAGRVICIFPEGTRSDDGCLQAGKSGVARIALSAGAPVVPMVCLNSRRLFRDILRWGRPTIAVRFGPPLMLAGDPAKSADARRETKRIMQAIADLLPEAPAGASPTTQDHLPVQEARNGRCEDG